MGGEALELFQSGRITFPLLCAVEILSIKRGERPYEAIASTIEQLLIEVESAAVTSFLPEEPDFAFIDELVTTAYREQVLR